MVLAGGADEAGTPGVQSMVGTSVTGGVVCVSVGVAVSVSDGDSVGVEVSEFVSVGDGDSVPAGDVESVDETVG